MRSTTLAMEWRDANVLTPDVESDITGYGAHNRLLVSRGTRSEAYELTVREDVRAGMALSTERQRRKVLNGWQRLHSSRERVTWLRSVRAEGRIYHEYLVHARVRNAEADNA
jgi:hypothetical protein